LMRKKLSSGVGGEFHWKIKIPDKEKVEETKNPWFAYSNRRAQVGPSGCRSEPTLLGGLQQAHHHAPQQPHPFHRHTVLVAPLLVLV